MKLKMLIFELLIKTDYFREYERSALLLIIWDGYEQYTIFMLPHPRKCSVLKKLF